MKKQTALDFLIDKMETFHALHQYKDVYEEAKRMEKEQIVNAYTTGLTPQVVYGSEKSQAEQYYNETYE